MLASSLEQDRRVAIKNESSVFDRRQLGRRQLQTLVQILLRAPVLFLLGRIPVILLSFGNPENLDEFVAGQSRQKVGRGRAMNGAVLSFSHGGKSKGLRKSANEPSLPNSSQKGKTFWPPLLECY